MEYSVRIFVLFFSMKLILIRIFFEVLISALGNCFNFCPENIRAENQRPFFPTSESAPHHIYTLIFYIYSCPCYVGMIIFEIIRIKRIISKLR